MAYTSLLVGCNDGYLYSISTNGQLQWKYNTGDFVTGGTAINSDGYMLIGSENHHLIGLGSDWSDSVRPTGSPTGTPVIDPTDPPSHSNNTINDEMIILIFCILGMFIIAFNMCRRYKLAHSTVIPLTNITDNTDSTNSSNTLLTHSNTYIPVPVPIPANVAIQAGVIEMQHGSGGINRGSARYIPNLDVEFVNPNTNSNTNSNTNVPDNIPVNASVTMTGSSTIVPMAVVVVVAEAV